MPHQMKGIGNGRQDVCLPILDTWKVFGKKTMRWGLLVILHICYVYKIICVLFFCLFVINAKRVL
jgi:hypothetical protein